MIPSSILKKIDTFEVEFHDGKVKVSLVDQACLLDDKLLELRNLLKTRVVGVDYKHEENANVLVLCVVSRCLIIHSGNWGINHGNLKTFLGDKTICFVEAGMPNRLTKLKGHMINSYLLPYGIECESGVEVGYLAYILVYYFRT